MVIYYGDKEWNGPKELYDMLSVSDKLSPFKNLIQNYKINLLEVRKIDNLDVYSDDIKVLFGFIKYQKDKKALQQFISKNKEIFSCVPMETCSTIEAVTNTKEIQKYIKKDEDGVINMCQAIEDMKKESEAIGEKRGEARGETRLSSLMSHLFEDGRMDDIKKAINNQEFRVSLYQEYSIK